MMDTKTLKKGTTVEWSSSAAGYTKTKRGEVVATVPPGQSPQFYAQVAELETGARRLTCLGGARSGLSYIVVVRVPPKNVGQIECKPQLYWPRTSKLRVVADSKVNSSMTNEEKHSASMNISLPEALKSFVDELVARDLYSSASEYVRELIRKARDKSKSNLLDLSCKTEDCDGTEFLVCKPGMIQCTTCDVFRMLPLI